MTAVKYDALKFDWQSVIYWECPKGDARPFQRFSK